MLIPLDKNDGLLHTRPFIDDEVRFNLLHRISGPDTAFSLRTPDGELAAAQTPGYNPWLWLRPGLPEERREALLRELAEAVADRELPGVSGDPEDAGRWAELIAAERGAAYELHMALNAYACRKVRPPSGIPGRTVKAAPRHAGRVAAFIAGFSADAFGVAATAEDKLEEARQVIAAGGLYLWVIGGEPAAMARIAHRSARHACINDVYTVPEHRKRGYASALVARLSQSILRDSLTPMLYADAANPHSNGVYRAIGFEEAGVVHDYRFKPIG